MKKILNSIVLSVALSDITPFFQGVVLNRIRYHKKGFSDHTFLFIKGDDEDGKQDIVLNLINMGSKESVAPSF